MEAQLEVPWQKRSGNQPGWNVSWEIRGNNSRGQKRSGNQSRRKPS
ncbi:uncharacterized protein CPUR_07145 [Claviceps purpurea 20.1]|uniref:Uncharacterized protein n=1 Tax=Claviceps purpurea (strain 20.1) TaxID=1111077 RepID=M1W411_CLAP2|nr:uncharacterized protein CPUR_07145 [Claviceps purpurea 20.1]